MRAEQEQKRWWWRAVPGCQDDWTQVLCSTARVGDPQAMGGVAISVPPEGDDEELIIIEMRLQAI